MNRQTDGWRKNVCMDDMPLIFVVVGVGEEILQLREEAIERGRERESYKRSIHMLFAVFASLALELFQNM